MFPNGYIKIRKSPVNQGNHFADYNWAKIYPQKDSPEQLAITVGISAEHLFLKIDTVNASSTLRADYEAIRGDYTNSTIVHNKPIEDGLNKNFDELVQWSASYFPRLHDQYNNVAYQLGLMSEKEDRRTYNDTFELSPLNQILYGPPGTGKTYHTIEAAVKAAEPSFVFTGRNELKAKYNELADAKRIRFVTFHQSYGYEEFVEGLRAESDEDKNIYYSIKDGAFKAISDKAAAHKISKPSMINEEARIWQLSIESSGNSKVKTHCLESDIGAIGWGNVGDMSPSKRTQENDEVLASESHPNQSTIRSFCNEMSIGDIVFCVSGQWTIEAIGVVTGDYQFCPDGVSHREGYCHTRPIKWLAKGLELNVFDLNCQTRLPIKTCSELTRFSLSELFAFLGENEVRLIDEIAPQNENYVLVIDEINRGNISKIFGELITLIEPSKRAGEAEGVELTLPYSGKPFSVPSNLHIIGTMNTADRSLAMMDTALRRRFDFVEMMPKPELLSDVSVNGIDLQKLLTVLNHRIEVLYDREHTLGHAFFMVVKEKLNQVDEGAAFVELQSVFKNKIIPLLEEYFFEDWDKIRLVLGDNQKSNSLQFVTEKQLDPKALNVLFGNKHGLEQFGEAQKQYSLKSKEADVWSNALAYIGIYAPNEANETESRVPTDNNTSVKVVESQQLAEEMDA